MSALTELLLDGLLEQIPDDVWLVGVVERKDGRDPLGDCLELGGYILVEDRRRILDHFLGAFLEAR